MALFSISCTTCKARLQVRDAAAVGQILACPKCSSMVLVELPAGMDPIAEERSAAEAPAATAGQRHPPAAPSPKLETADPLPPEPDPITDETPHATPQPAASKQPVSDSTPDALAEPAQPTHAWKGSPAAALLPTADWTTPATRQWQQMLLSAGAALTGVALAVGVIGFLVMRSPSTDPSPSVAAADPDPDPDSPVLPADLPPDLDTSKETDKLDSTAQTGETVRAGEPGKAGQADQAEQPDQADQRPSSDEPEPVVDGQTVDEPKESGMGDEPAMPGEPSPSGTGGDKRSDPAKAMALQGGPRPDLDGPPDLVPRSDEEGSDDQLANAASLTDRFDELAPLLDDTPYSPDGPTDTSPALPGELPDPELEDVPQISPEGRLEVDIEARLADKIAQIEFQDVPLVDFLDFLSQFSTLPIALDPQALALMRLTPDSPVQVQLEDATVGDALAAALKPHRLEYVAGDGYLLVTTAAAPRPRKLTVSDLVGEDRQRLQRLAQSIVELVAPDSWTEAGGTATLRLDDQALTVEQTLTAHFQVLVLCEKLRVARGNPPRSSYPAALFRLTPRFRHAEQNLEATVAVNYAQPVSWVRILQNLERAAGMRILIDWQAVTELGWGPQAETRFTVQQLSLDKALDRLLRPMGLTWRVVNETTLQVTTRVAMLDQPELELYPVNDLLQQFDGPQLLAQIRTELGEHRFAEGGGSGALHLDDDSQHLLAALPQPLQRALAELLDQLRTDRLPQP